MGRAPCCAKVGLHRGPWTPKEDALLTKYIQAHGEGQWRSLPKRAGLLRCGKSCRLRWMNYLRPDIKRGNITPEEDDLIIRMHSLLGNRWSLIAGRLPGRTDNEIKNYWNTHLSKRLKTQLGPHHQEAVPKRRNKINTNKKKKSSRNINTKNRSNNNVEEEAEEEKKTNIYLPKPIRVSALSISRNDSTTTSTLDSNYSSSSSQDKDESPELLQQTDVNANNYGLWGESENAGFGFFVEEDINMDLVNASTSQDDTMEGHSLEKLYDEYLQLLKNNNNGDESLNQEEWDCFAQSLFV